MASKYRLQDLQKCLNRIQVISNTFELMTELLEKSDEVQDKDECIEISDRITVGINEIQQMLQEDIMLEEIT